MSPTANSWISTVTLQDLVIPREMVPAEYYWQFPIVLLLYFLARIIARKSLGPRPRHNPEPGLKCWFMDNAAFIILFAFLALLSILGLLLAVPFAGFELMTALLALWLAFALLAAWFRDRVVVRLIAFIAYLILSLYFLGWLDMTIAILDRVRLPAGNLNISAYSVLTGLIVLIITLWLAQMASRILEKRIHATSGISPSIKVLIGKSVKIAFLAIAILVAVNSMGLDLTVLTVVGGGLGLGLGFGLQKVVSNLLSGFILLTDKSIKPGDVIEIEGTYGWINKLGARFVSIITRDNTEHLIPNENLITQQVVNWSFTDNLIRLKVPIGIAYRSDPHEAIRLVLEAIDSMDRILKIPKPTCLLLGFGDSSIDLQARFWIDDPAKGISNIKSKLLLKVWDVFKENDIEIPYPQRDLHIKSSPPFHLDLPPAPPEI